MRTIFVKSLLFSYFCFCLGAGFAGDNYVLRGRQVLAQLHAQGASQFLKNKSDAEHLHDIISVIWYLSDLAGKRGQEMCEGMFLIADPAYNLFDFLLRYKYVYPRISSHFPVSSISQYGIDIPKEQRDVLSLPHNYYHILFGKTDRAGYIFIEPEPYGLQYWSDGILHLKDYMIHTFQKWFMPWVLEQEGYHHEGREVVLSWPDLLGE